MSLKRRIIPTLLVRGGSLVKGERFNSWRSIGFPLQALNVYESRNVDEIILLDIGATPNGYGPDLTMIKRLTKQCFTPLTVGGGVRDVETIRELLKIGADKVSIGTAALEHPELIVEAAKKFGSQCITVSIDVKNDRVATRCGSISSVVDPVVWAKCVATMGAGEILLTSVDRDGTMEGYDLDLIETVSRSVSIPVIASGGARDYADFNAAFKAGAHAVAASALFQFSESTPRGAKRYLSEKGVLVRL